MPEWIKVESPKTATVFFAKSRPAAFSMPWAAETLAPMQMMLSMEERGAAPSQGIAANVAGNVKPKLVEYIEHAAVGTPGAHYRRAHGTASAAETVSAAFSPKILLRRREAGIFVHLGEQLFSDYRNAHGANILF